jgi:hypothetical protein
MLGDSPINLPAKIPMAKGFDLTLDLAKAKTQQPLLSTPNQFNSSGNRSLLN